jgi:hypothetical protein
MWFQQGKPAVDYLFILIRFNDFGHSKDSRGLCNRRPLTELLAANF